MNHLPSLIYDLVLILAVAGVVTLVFKWLRQPLVLGYVVAGLLAGPHIGLIPTVADTLNVTTWADIGVIFLLFALGLEFSFKKLMSVGKTGTITAITEVIAMMAVGVIVGKLLHWPAMDGLFLGGMLSMSSTTIIIKSFDDLGLRKQKFAQLVFGVLVIEDLVAILMMVLLSTLAVSQTFSGAEMMESLLKLGFFLILWFVAGIFLIPSLLRKVKRFLTDETLLVVCVGLCLCMVVIAVSAGFSAALGAFIMGSILAETSEVERIERVIKPVKDLFGAIFFVSVGMMVDPEILVEYAWPIVAITFATIFGKLIFSSTGVLLSGQSLHISMQSGFSLAQIGEFAFIIASLGQSLKVTSNYLYPIVVTVSVITTFLTPYLISLADPVYQVVVNWLSPSLKTKLCKENISDETVLPSESDEQGWGPVLKNYFLNLVLFSIILYSIVWLSFKYLVPFLQMKMPETTSHFVSAGIILLAMSPLLRALMYNRDYMPSTVLNLWIENARNRVLLSLLMMLRFFVAFMFVVYVLHQLFSIPPIAIFIITFVLLLIASRSKKLLKWYWHLESRFLVNLNERQVAKTRADESKRGVRNVVDVEARHWLDSELYVVGLVLLEGNRWIGKSLKHTDLRSEYNLFVIRVQQVEEISPEAKKAPDTKAEWSKHVVRSENIPVGDYTLQLHDILYIAGEKDSLMRMQHDESHWRVVRNSMRTLQEFAAKQAKMKEAKEKLICVAIPVVAESGLLHANLRESELSRNTKCLILGLERKGEQIINPSSDTTLQEDDVVWIIGEEKPIAAIIEKNVFL